MLQEPYLSTEAFADLVERFVSLFAAVQPQRKRLTKVEAEDAHHALCVRRLATITDPDPERLRRRQVRQGPRIFKRTDSDAQFHREKPSTYAVQTFIYRV